MWEKIKKGLKKFYDIVWHCTPWKEKTSLLIGLIVGIIMGTIVVHGELAKSGCKILTPLSYFWNGFVGLLIIFTGFVLMAMISYALLSVPEKIKDYLKSLEWRRKDREAARKYKLLLRDRLGYKYIDPETLKKIRFWTVTILCVVVLVVFISMAAGYIWWSIFC